MKFKAYLAEFIGTFALVFVAVFAAHHFRYDGLLGEAFASGITIGVFATATIPLSGGHLNPAVTLVMLMTKRIKTIDAIAYWISQLMAAFFAAYLVKTAMGVESMERGTTTISETMRTVAIVDTQAAWNAMVLEAVATFFLVFVIFATVVDKRAPKTGGLFIGAVVTMGIIAIGPMTGAAMNPARWFGPAFASGQFATSPFTMSNLVTTYVAGPALGAIVAALVYQYVFMGRDQLPGLTADSND